MRTTTSVARALAAVALGTGSALADIQPTAKAPLAPPLFSFDLASPSVGLGLRASDVLRTPGPTIEVPAPNLGLFFPNTDELDAISFSNDTVGPASTFVITFSVDRLSVGLADPDPTLVAAGFPFNAKDQAAKGQAAGDQFMTLTLFDKSGPTDGGDANPNNTMPRNQGDAGGVDFGADPNVSPAAVTGAPLDEVDAGATPPPGSIDLSVPIFFSLKNGSQSLLGTPFLPPGDGATIYVDQLPNQQNGQQVYAQGFQLGLQPGDDIAALIVFDDGDYFFENNIDQVIFTLSRDSPTLAGPLGPADLLTSQGNNTFVLYAAAQLLGLLTDDHVDMLDLALCDNIDDCVNRWAIGYFDIGDFEPVQFKGSSTGEPTGEQEGWYVPKGGDPQFVYTYAANTLGVPPNPLGDLQFSGALNDLLPTGFVPAAEHYQGYTAGDQYQLRFDFYGSSTAAPAAELLGQVSLQPSKQAMTIAAMATVPDPNDPSLFRLGFLGEDIHGTPTPPPGVAPDPSWESLVAGEWYRVCICFDFGSRQLTRICIRNLSQGTPSQCVETLDLFIGGSLAKLPHPTALRLEAGGEGNIAAFDNVGVTSGPCGCPSCPGDLDGDNLIGQGDLGILLAAWGTCPGGPGYNFTAGSLAGDLCVGQSDLGYLLSFYGTACP